MVIDTIVVGYIGHYLIMAVFLQVTFGLMCIDSIIHPLIKSVA